VQIVVSVDIIFRGRAKAANQETALPQSFYKELHAFMNHNPTSYGGSQGQGQSPDPYQETMLASNQPGSNPNNYPNNPGSNPGSNPNNYPNNPYGAPPPPLSAPGGAPYDPYAIPPTVSANPAQPPSNPYQYPNSAPGINQPPTRYPYPNQGPPSNPANQPAQYPYPNQGPPSNPANQYSYPGSFPPAYNATPPPAPRRSSGSKTVLIILAILVVVGGLVAVIGVTSRNSQIASDNQHATATVNANTAATAQAQVQAKATSTAQVNATATAVVSTYPFSANLKLEDPLMDNSKGVGWVTDKNCKFASDGYHASEPEANVYYTCPALKGSYKDFTYQVTMNVTKGSVAGLTFRGNDSARKYYSFIFDQTGGYVLFLYTQDGQKPQTLHEGTADNYNAHQANDIGVVARGNQIKLYLNKQELTTVSDSTFSSGQIGTIVYNTSGPVETVFSNAKLWQL
jgi:hypothetical protein